MFLLTKLWSLASAAIPCGTILYIALLYRIMEKNRYYEMQLNRIARMYQEKLFVDTPVLD